VLPGNHKEDGQGHIGSTAPDAKGKAMDFSSRSSLVEDFSKKEKKAGTAYRRSLIFGHFYFGLTLPRSLLANPIYL
jgi:hypothetical protein